MPTGRYEIYVDRVDFVGSEKNRKIGYVFYLSDELISTIPKVDLNIFILNKIHKALEDLKECE